MGFMGFIGLGLILGVCVSVAGAKHGAYNALTEALLSEMVSRLDNDATEYLNNRLKDELEPRVIKDMETEGDHYFGMSDYDIDNNPNAPPAIRDQEFLQHSPLWGHQYVTGGAGEGKQRLRPNGLVRHAANDVKTDAVLPAYCDPPNPCPKGYGNEDGCLEEFENSAAFSRDYQGSQECMCDSEHMFDCPLTTRDAEINVLARSIQNEGLVDHTVDRLVHDLQQGDDNHKVVAKKGHPKPPHNPYLTGDKLPIVAKKG